MSFKVPEHLRFRQKGHPLDSLPGAPYGAFLCRRSLLLPRGLKIIASAGDIDESGAGIPWEHISVSHVDDDECPSWHEMTLAAGLFWDDADCLVQYRPPRSDYVDLHPGCLHWWRWKQGDFPLPPKACV